MKIYFNGCSITAGTGFVDGKNDSQIYPNLVAKNYNSDCINDAEGGSSNLKIFTKTAKAMIDGVADIYIIQWSAPHRHWLYPAPDQGLYIGSPFEENQHRDFVERFQHYNHDYPNLMSVIDYSRILVELANRRSHQIVFVNGMLFWKNVWNDMYMKSLLEDLAPNDRQLFQERFDNNIDLLDIDNWANPWISIAEIKEDDAPLDTHPGPQTHRKVADMVLAVIDNKQRPL